MPLSRREFLRLSGLIAGGAALASCRPLYDSLADLSDAPFAAPLGDPRDFQILKRLTYGPQPTALGRLSSIGPQAWLEEQLAPKTIDDTPLQLRLRTFDFLDHDADALVAWDREELVPALQEAALLNKVYSRRQLYEMMVEFWGDHFNIAVAKGDCWFLKVVDDREVIRAHALGNFRDLLWASAHSPAMLVYLDNQVNHRDAPNENYARELLELHTLGVDNGYAQNDVMELARCLTGWTVKEHFWRGEFTFDPDSHDPGPKTVLGYRIEPAGQAEAERVLELLALHPATARHLAQKLVRRFVRPIPDPESDPLVEETAQVFLRTRGDLRATLRTVLENGVLPPNLLPAPLYKRPLDFVASALRALHTRISGGATVLRYLNSMGQPLFEWPSPDGPSLESAAWQGNLLPRWQFGLVLALGELEGASLDLAGLLGPPGHRSPDRILATLYNLTLGGAPSKGLQVDLLGALAKGPDLSEEELAAVICAGLIASPAFQWR